MNAPTPSARSMTGGSRFGNESLKSLPAIRITESTAQDNRDVFHEHYQGSDNGPESVGLPDCDPEDEDNARNLLRSVIREMPSSSAACC